MTTPPTAPPTTSPGPPPVAALARPTGTFAMVAADQRDSLRTLVAEHTGRDREAVADAELTAFKLSVARELGPLASALLIDRAYGYRTLIDRRVLPEGCAPILAVDALEQLPGGPEIGRAHV